MMCTSKRAVIILLLPASLREVGNKWLYLCTLAVGCCLIEFFFSYRFLLSISQFNVPGLATPDDLPITRDRFPPH